jgi:hypothetical protein
MGKSKILLKTGTLLNLRQKMDKLLGGASDKNKKKGKMELPQGANFHHCWKIIRMKIAIIQI